MAIHLCCPHCARGLKLGTRQAGTRIFCPICTGIVQVPAADTAIRTRPQPVRRALPARAPAPKPSPLTRPRSAIHYPLVAATAGACVVFVVGLIVVSGIVVQRSRRVTQAAPAQVVAVVEETPLPDEGPLQKEAAPTLDLLTLAPPPAPLVLSVRPPAREIADRRRTRLTDEDLRRDLFSAPELGMDDIRNFRAPEPLSTQPRPAPNTAAFSLQALMEHRAGLPARMGDDCQLDRESAANLRHFSQKMRGALAAAGNAADPATGADVIRRALDDMTGYRKIENGRRTNFREEVIPTAMQMLCVETRLIRLVLIEYLSDVKHPAASEALAKIALFDLSEKVRAEAVRALAERPRSEYRYVLLSGLRYPWPAIADNAAEALVTLADRDAVADLKTLADEPDPTVPYFDRSRGTYLVREVVRVNHLSNCVMCHAPSTDTNDLVRGRIPTPGEPLAPPVQYYESNEGPFVRADVTYLKQDFSVMQPVDHSRPWPTMQRFDYLIRTRPISFGEGEAGVAAAKRQETYPQREAVLYALKELEVDARPSRRETVSQETLKP